MRKLILIACALRLLTNLSKYVIIDDQTFAYVFLFGCLIFELVALIYFEKKETNHKELSSMFLNFCIGLNLYSLFKLCFANPFHYSVAEYWSVLIGLIIVLIRYGYAKIFN